MAKKLIIFFLCVFFQCLSSQTHRFIYEYRFTLDRDKTDQLNVEFMNLDIADEEIVFYGQARFQNDSININSIIEQLKLTLGSTSISDHMEQWNTKYIVKKNPKTKETNWVTSVGNTAVSVIEKPLQNWKILAEKERIENYDCQKAICTYGGRNWTAWFTNDIPIAEGPYKFHGLPGLIVKLEDQTQTHQFLLKGSKKLEEGEPDWSYLEKLNNETYGVIPKPVVVTRKQFAKLWREYVNDPVKDLRQELSRPGFSMEMIVNGKKITNNVEILKMQEEMAKKSLRKTNNQLEIDLYPMP